MQLQKLHRTTRGGRGTGRRRTPLAHSKERHTSLWTKDVQVIFNFGPVFVSPLSSRDVIGVVPPMQQGAGRSESLQDVFRTQVESWKADTQHWSSVARMISHPSYLRIIGLARQSAGYEIERLLLQELSSEPDHWFEALTAITGENPVKPEDDFDAAVDAWIGWGQRKGILAA